MQTKVQVNQSVRSSNTIQSDPLRVATTRVGSTENTEPLSSKSLKECGASPTTPTMSDSSSIPYIRTDNTSDVFPWMITVTPKGLFKFFHVENFENASDEEVMFLAQLQFRMHANVRMLAREACGKADRMAEAVLSAVAKSSFGDDTSAAESAT